MADDARDANGNIVSFPSARTPGATVYQDPITPTSGFYRSLAVGDHGVTTDEVVSGGYGDTGADPASLVVPGNAAVSTDGRPLFSGLDTRPSPSATLPAGTRLRVVEQPTQTTADGRPPGPGPGRRRSVDHRLHAATDLAARDSVAPSSASSTRPAVLAQRRRRRDAASSAAASPNRSPGTDGQEGRGRSSF